MIATNLYKGTKRVEGWKDEETFKNETSLILEHVGTDIEESCSKVIPYVLPTCKKNGTIFRGFKIMKLIKGFRTVNKLQKQAKKN